MAAVVEAEQDARCEFDGRGSNAKACPALKVVEEGLQGLVQDLLGGLGRMDVPPARPMAGPGIQLLDVQTLQCVLDIAGDGRPVGVRDDLDGLGFGRFTQVRPGSEQLIEHDGFRLFKGSWYQGGPSGKVAGAFAPGHACRQLRLRRNAIRACGR